MEDLKYLSDLIVIYFFDKYFISNIACTILLVYRRFILKLNLEESSTLISRIDQLQDRKS